MLRQLFLFLLMFLVLGCGGGGGSEPSSIPEPPTSDIVSTPAETIIPALSDLLTPLLYAIPELNEAKDISAQRYQLGGIPCAAMPESDIGKIISRTRRLELTNCNLNAMILNGTVQSVEDLKGQAVDVVLTYSNVELRNGAVKYTISGSSKIRVETGDTKCLSRTKITHNLRFQSASSTVQLQNLMVSINGSANVYCDTPGVTVAGVVIHSKFGRYDLTTETPLSLIRAVGAIRQGGAVVLKATKQLLRFNIEQHYPTITGKFEVFDGAKTSLFVMATPLNIAKATLFSDFNDDDADGLPNGYEIALGLNPNNPADAKQDADNDGFNNLIEFKYGGNPLDNSTKPQALSAGFQQPIPPKLQFMEPDFRVELPFVMGGGQINTTTIHAKAVLTGDMQFTAMPNCVLSNNNKMIVCDLVNNSTASALQFAVTTDSYNYNEVKASLRVETTYSNPDITEGDDIYIGEIVRQALVFPPNFSHRITYDAQNFNPNKAFTMVKDQAVELTLNADFIGVPPMHGYLTPVLPAAVEVQKMECFNDVDDTWQPCSRLAFVNALKFKLTLVGRKAGFYELSFDLSHDERNPAVAAQYKMQATIGEPTAALQQQIDAAPSGETLTVPAGIYVGKLDLSAKPIHLVADGAVHLLTTNISPNGGPDFAAGISLKLNHQSSVQGFVLASHFVYVDTGGGMLLHNQLGDLQHGLLQNYIATDGDLTLQYNVVDTVSAATDANSVAGLNCPAFVIGPYASAQPLNVVFANNVIYTQNYCGNALSLRYATRMSFVHNTIINMSNFMGINTEHLQSKHQIVMDNNLYVANGADFATLNGYAGAVPGNSFSANNNLFWGVAPEVIGYSYKNMQVTNSMYGDPKLVNSYQLAVGSAAIDSAVPSVNLPVPVDLPVALDGNGDGQKQLDIGAYEFKP